jgi:excisionase family DNA binding protein
VGEENVDRAAGDRDGAVAVLGTPTTPKERVTVLPSPTPREGFATVLEAAAFLRTSRGFIYGLMDKGELEYARFGTARRIAWATLHSYVERCTVSAS